MTTYKQKFNKLMKTSVAAAQEKFLRDGALFMTTWLIEDKYDIRIMLAFAPDVSKQIMLEKMRQIAKEKDIVRYAVELEAWSAVSMDDNPDLRRPKERPDRMETLVIMGEDRQNNRSCTMIEIERKGDKAYLGEPIETDSFQGDFRLFEDEAT